MLHGKKRKRIVTCQGGIQLVAALAALRSHQKEQKRSGSDNEYEDFLVVYDLSAPDDQIEKFAAAVRQMAVAAARWEVTTYITHQQMSYFANVDASRAADIFAQVYELVGTSEADEIYLCRNFLFSNVLMMNAYRDAEKICFGDGIGIYFSDTYFAPTVAPPKALAQLRQKVGKLKRALTNRTTNRPSTINDAKVSMVLKEIDFDIGYFLLPDILGDRPLMKTRSVRKEITTGILQQLAETEELNYIENRHTNICCAPTVVLLTSNFSESGRMSPENEIRAYTEFFEQQNFPTESMLIIKPHPRDGAQKIEVLGRRLERFFSAVILLLDPELFFLPFEVFLMQAFQGKNRHDLRDLKIVSFSTACLSLEVIFGLNPVIGFGSELVRKYFRAEYASGRIKHEGDLQLGLSKLKRNL